MLAGDRDGMRQLEHAVESADALGQGFMARLGRACTALGQGAGRAAEAAAAGSACERIGDRWGAACAALVQGWGVVLSGSGDAEAPALLDSAAGMFHELGSGVLEA
jgi:hypothetical protein